MALSLVSLEEQTTNLTPLRLGGRLLFAIPKSESPPRGTPTGTECDYPSTARQDFDKS